MTRRTKDLFATITTEGTLLPPDLLQRVAAEDREIGGLTPADYHLSGERLREAITRAWNRLLAAWRHFETARASLAEGDLGTSITRERWLLPLFQELGYGRLEGSGGFEIEGKRFAVSHLWRHVPIHLVGCRVDLDRHAAGVAGAARASPHGLMQELLNRRDDFLWGFVANGLRLRILRDSRALTRQAYVEFDLESMLRGERYADFTVLWLIVHESRVEADKPSDSWLEKWTQAAAAQGTRALEQLRDGVTKAIESLGRGFLAHTKSDGNRALRARLESGELAAQDYYRELLRLVYRMLFLFVAEDRGLLLDPAAPDDAKERFRRWYSTVHLRQRAERRRGGAHVDLWCGLRVVMNHLAEGRAELALPGLGSFLWSREASPNLIGADVANRDLLDAIRALAFTSEGGGLRAVDWKNLGSEELGSVYESLLELHPRIENDAFTLATAGGNERKTSGSYYTPSSLVECLLDSALDPVLEEAAKKSNAEQAILALKVCDPACGSGHFLIAAAHRIARRLASVRTGDDEPSPEATRHALRDVIGRCLYGVDVNPMAVELCKVSLWMEALEPGRPLSFLDHRIQCGNSLLGTTPALLAKGIPDDAFEPIEGDEKEFARALKKQNRDERKKKASVLPFAGTLAEPEVPYGSLATSVKDLGAADDLTLASVRRKEELWRRLIASPEYAKTRLFADAWCAAFVWRKSRHAKAPLTQAVFEQLRRDPEQASTDVRLEVGRLGEQYRFLHWHLAFPDVFQVPVAEGGPLTSAALGWSGGFDAVLGNPPWERIKLQEKEFFAQRRPEIASARNASERRKLIEELREKDPLLLNEFADACRAAESESHFARDAGRFPFCGRGDVNTYTLFAEGMRQILSPTGRMGAIVPSGIATDDTTKEFFEDLIRTRTLARILGFENEEKLFPAIHHAAKFALLFVSGTQIQSLAADFMFFARRVSELDRIDRHFTLAADDIKLLNPNTRTCPVFRTCLDAELTKAIYRRTPVVILEDSPEQNPWGVSLAAMFHMSGDSGLFRTRERLASEGFRLDGNVFHGDGIRYLPLYEAKMVFMFDHRAADISINPTAVSRQGESDELSARAKLDPHRLPLPRFWVAATEVNAHLASRWNRSWLLGFRDITATTNTRTVIASALPREAGAGDTFLLAFPCHASASEALAFLACLNSFACDYVARQKIGGMHLKFHVFKQLAVPPPLALRSELPWNESPSRTVGTENSAAESVVSTTKEARRSESGCAATERASSIPKMPLTWADWLLHPALELVYTAHDLAPLARDCGYNGAPFRWDEDRRILLRCEVDAAFFHLYLGTPDEWRRQPEALTRELPTPRAAIAHMLETFPIVRRQDEVRYGTYRTKNLILEIYDQMTDAMASGKPYATRLNPPPADPSMAHRIGAAPTS